MLAVHVCMQGACPCSNPVITRPGAPEEEPGPEEGWKDGQGAKGWVAGLKTRLEKGDFQSDDSKGAAWGEGSGYTQLFKRRIGA